MIFRSTRMRHALAIVAVIAGLAACGGGTSQVETFVPDRLLVFGDENSLVAAGGAKYNVNGYTVLEDGSEVLDCNSVPTWVQSMAAFYGFVFAECNPTNVENPKALMLALEGARVEDIKIQLDALVAAGGFGSKDMATMLAGGNDILELYRQFPVRSEADLTNEARERGRRMAQEVNRLVGFGAKVIVSTVPDMGLTPYALKQRLEFGDTDRAALLSRLTIAFNEQLGVNILLDGRFIGLVQADLRTQAMSRIPQAFGLANVSDGACQENSPPPLCTTKTLVEGANPASWMWADDTRYGYPIHQQIASLAIDRARRNPF
jgi:outer membrane lipase/esterase